VGAVALAGDRDVIRRLVLGSTGDEAFAGTV
jgi:hypothetical protein